jgi:hypothetical protein
MDEVVINAPKEEAVEEVKSLAAEKKVVKKRVVKPKAKKKSAFKFDGSKYKEIETYAETLPVRQLNRRGQLVVEKTPTGRDLEREVMSKEFVSTYGNGNLHNAKCKYRACENFDVTIEHLTKGYSLLSGKKIDGYWATDLIDRFGWSDGEQMSRAMLSKRYNKNVASVDIAQEKLCDILNTADIQKAYIALVQDIKEEFSRDLREKVVYGE